MVKAKMVNDPIIFQAACQFSPAVPETITPLPGGNINRTWLVEGAGAPFILQEINSQVFTRPTQCCLNHARLSQELQRLPSLAAGWRFPALLPCLASDKPWWYDPGGRLWRALEFVADTISLTSLDVADQAVELGHGLALFHRFCAAIPLQELPTTIDHFHDTPYYLAQLFKAPASPEPEVEHWLRFCQKRQPQAEELSQAQLQGRVALTVCHGDPKLANFLFDRDSRQACSLIDLDTLGPGLRLHDLGDCLRSCAASEPEDTGQPPSFDLQVCASFLAGYQGTGPDLLSDQEVELLARAVWLLPFELGCRFFTEHLHGHSYFHCRYPGQNLVRAQGQFGLVCSIEEQWLGLEDLVRTTLKG